MYRQMTLQSQPPQIYCSRCDWCDHSCGKFHREQRTVRQIVSAIEAAVVEASDAMDRKRQQNEDEQQEQSSAAGGEGGQRQPHLVVLTQPSEGEGGTGAQQQRRQQGEGQQMALCLPPVSPQSTSPSQASQASGSMATSVTLDDIIASARRKISEEYKEIRIPSPEMCIDGQDSTFWDKRAAKKRLVFHESSLDIPAMDQLPTAEWGDAPEWHQYDDQESEAELFIQEEPPSFIGDDEEGEDFEEVIKVTKPPQDAFSNPILLRDADPLTMRKKRRAKGGGQLLPRQQSFGRLQRLASAGPLPPSQSSTPSGHRTELEEVADNSSIDLSLAELSAGVAAKGGGLSIEGSTVTSPSNIFKFIEEQRQKTVEGTAAAAEDLE